jgi:hypothetical protein
MSDVNVVRKQAKTTSIFSDGINNCFYFLMLFYGLDSGINCHTVYIGNTKLNIYKYLSDQLGCTYNRRFLSLEKCVARYLMQKSLHFLNEVRKIYISCGAYGYLLIHFYISSQWNTQICFMDNIHRPVSI